MKYDRVSLWINLYNRNGIRRSIFTGKGNGRPAKIWSGKPVYIEGPIAAADQTPSSIHKDLLEKTGPSFSRSDGDERDLAASLNLHPC
jgi:hypothetical protein